MFVFCDGLSSLYSLRQLDEVEVIEGHLVAVTTEHVHKPEFVHAG
jgi:hypothetical protein